MLSKGVMMGKFSNLSLKEKRKHLLKHNGELSHRERVGLLGELLIEGKSNADAFLEATGGMKSLYPEIAQMLMRFPLLFLVDFFDGDEIPFRPEVNWKRYLWGAAWKSYREWSAQKAEEKTFTTENGRRTDGIYTSIHYRKQ